MVNHAAFRVVSGVVRLNNIHRVVTTTSAFAVFAFACACCRFGVVVMYASIILVIDVRVSFRWRNHLYEQQWIQ